MAQTLPATGHRRLIGRLLLLVAGGFAFAFAMVPLYNVLCAATGFNGKSSLVPDSRPAARAGTALGPVDLARSIRVDFTGTVMPGLPWEMRPLTPKLEIHPGELQQVSYLVRNTSDQTIVGQAVPSISPGQAARYFEKIECFCFTRQTLAPGESREMPVAFIVKPEVDGEISQITLSYAFFSLDGQRRTLTESRENPR